MPGPLPKDGDKRQRRAGRGPKVVRPDEFNPPSPPEGLREETQTLWWDYWNSDVAWLLRVDTDIAAVERYFQMLDEIKEAQDVIDEEGLTVPGSKDQDVEHPMLRHIDRLRRQCVQLEDRLGMSMKARRLLGIAAQKRKTLDDRNQRAQDGGTQEKKDPRIALKR